MCTCVQRYHQLHNPRGKTPSLVPVCIVVAVQSLSHVQLFVTPQAAAHRASLSLTISGSSPKFMSIGSVIPPNHMLCHPLLLLPSILSSLRVFSDELVVCIHFSLSPSSEYSGLISFRMDWLDLLAVQGTLKSLLQHLCKHQLFGVQPSLWSNSHNHT